MAEKHLKNVKKTREKCVEEEGEICKGNRVRGKEGGSLGARR